MDNNIKPKRKTHTSTAVKRRYNDKTYTRFVADLRNELYAEVDQYIKARGISRAKFIQIAFESLDNKTGNKTGNQEEESEREYYSCLKEDADGNY